MMQLQMGIQLSLKSFLGAFCFLPAHSLSAWTSKQFMGCACLSFLFVSIRYFIQGSHAFKHFNSSQQIFCCCWKLFFVISCKFLFFLIEVRTENMKSALLTHLSVQYSLINCRLYVVFSRAYSSCVTETWCLLNNSPLAPPSLRAFFKMTLKY